MFRDIEVGSKELPWRKLKSLYDKDFLAWSKQQAQALRTARAPA